MNDPDHANYGVLDELAQRHRCMFGTADSYCAAPATVHVLMLGDHPTMSCAQHASWWDTHRHRDTHPLMATCGLPGTTWMYAALSESGFTPGYCAVEGLDAPALVEHAEAHHGISREHSRSESPTPPRATCAATAPNTGRTA